MEASDGALSMFGVEHASAAITLRDPNGEKILHLSPVALALRSAVFATRFRPGGNDWGPIVFEVESVAIAETILRQCYVADFANVSRRLSDPLDWSEIAIFLRTCDMLQMTPDIVVDLLRRVAAGVSRQEISASEVLSDLLDMRETSVGASRGFESIVRGSASAILTRAPDFDAAIAGTPRGLRADVLWLALQNPKQSYRSDILPMIAENIDSEEGSAVAHLRYLASWREITATHDLSAGGEGYSEAIVLVRKIEGDEFGDSSRLRARDRFACFLLEIIYASDIDRHYHRVRRPPAPSSSKKRARDESGEVEVEVNELDFSDFESSD